MFFIISIIFIILSFLFLWMLLISTKKSRTVELNIVEGKDLEMSSIENISSKSAIDLALAPYIRKSNDIVAALPASKYRASFTGLSYVDMIDLSNSQELNTIDGEKKKWTIAYQHIKNPSIGPWKEYRYYIDSHIFLSFIPFPILHRASQSTQWP